MQLWSHKFLCVVWMRHFCMKFGMFYKNLRRLLYENISISMSLLKKSLSVFVVEGVEENVCIIKSND